MTFTTRPEILGTFGVATSTHWIASAVGMSLLEKGGTAFDAAAGMAFTLHVVEPHLNGPFGDMPALIRLAGENTPRVVCGQGTAPAGATIKHYREEGLDMIPGSGLLATVIPGAFDAWMLLLRDHGRLPLRHIGLRDKAGLHTELAKFTGQQLDGGAEHGMRTHHMVAGLEQAKTHHENGRHTRSR